MHTYRIGTDVTVLNDHQEIPGLGYLPINAFVLHAREPVVVDTGLSLPDRQFVEDLGAVMDPADVRWIWLTHPDRDHTGGLFDLLDAAPHARVITTFLGAGILSTERPLPLDRVYLLNPGQRLPRRRPRWRTTRPRSTGHSTTTTSRPAPLCFSASREPPRWTVPHHRRPCPPRRQRRSVPRGHSSGTRGRLPANSTF